MLIAQAFATFFGVLVILKVYHDFRARLVPWPVFTFWLLTWLGVIVIALFPGLTTWLKVHVLGPDTGIGTIFGMSLVALLFLSYRLYIKADRVERKLNRLLTRLAVRDLDDSN